jgi:hypothetical protein
MALSQRPGALEAQHAGGKHLGTELLGKPGLVGGLNALAAASRRIESSKALGQRR